MEKTCQICIEDFTAIKRKPINCQKCQFICCTECLKKNCLNGSDAMCMNPDCRSLFQETYLYENLSSNFMTGKYRQKKAEIIFDREKSLMEGTMQVVENNILREKTTQKIAELNKQRDEIQRKINTERHNLSRLHQNQNLTNLNDPGSSSQEQTEKKTAYLKKCPTENCKGFLNLAYKCQLCEVSVCSKCFGLKEEDHTCNEDELKTAELLRKDTKACPNCGEMIHKIMGCNQMFCVSCDTGFDWTTLKIVTGVLHNPHYWALMNRQNQQNGRNIARTPGDILCGGPPEGHEILNKFRQVYQVPENHTPNPRSNYYGYNRAYYQTDTKLSTATGGKSDIALFWSRLCLHVSQVELPRYNTGNTFEINLKDRISYMRNLIDEKKYKTNIMRKHNDGIRKIEIVQLFQTFHTVIEDKLRNLILPETDSIEKIDNILTECNDITSYINNCFQKQSNLFKVRLPKIVYNTQAADNKVYNITIESKATYPK